MDEDEVAEKYISGDLDLPPEFELTPEQRAIFFPDADCE